jgi:hypothetical protein
MNKVVAVLLSMLVALAVMGASGCDSGIGMGVPSSGARWSGGPGPDVLVGGGPAYR